MRRLWAIYSRLLLLTIVMLAIIFAGEASARAYDTAQCGPLLAPCTVTVQNESVWPITVGIDAVTVDGHPAMAIGPRWVGPFGSAVIRLYDAGGIAYRDMGSVAIYAGPFLSSPGPPATLILRH